MWQHTRLRCFSSRNWQHRPSSTAVRFSTDLERERTCTRARQHPMKTFNDVKANAVHVQDVRCATLLSELVYRAAESPDETTFRVAQAQVEEAVGAQLSHVRCHKSGGQRFLVGETDNAIYVAFQGTKSAIDWLANLSFIHGHFGWHHHHHKQRHHHHHSSSGSSSGSSSASASSRSSSASRTSSSTSRSSRAHIGFLKRANSAAVSISELHAAAAAAGKRLVLTGHSLGGAVAVLTTVRLLRSLTPFQFNEPAIPVGEAGTRLSADDLQGAAPCSQPNICCISFATPAMANSDLLQEVTAAGWDQFITNIVMPEDPVVPFVNLLLKAPQAPHAQHTTIRPSDFFSGLDNPRDRPRSSSSSAPAAEVSELTCSVSQDSISWGSTLTYEAPEATGSLAGFTPGVDVQAAAALQSPLGPLTGYMDQTAPESTPPHAVSSTNSSAASPDLPTSIMVKALTEELLAGCCSTELSSWLAAARGTVSQRAGSQPSQCSLMESSASHSSSAASLFSLQSELQIQWPASSSDEDSSSSSAIESPSAMSPFTLSETSQGLGCSFGVPIVASWALESTSSAVLTSDRGSAVSAGSCEELQCHQGGVQQVQEHVQAGAQVTAGASDQEEEAAAAAARTATDQQASAGLNLGAQVVRQLRRLKQRLGGARVGRVAWVTGALAAGARCAAALAAPSAVPGADLSLLGVLPRALVGPVALAVLHLVGRAAYQAALPASHPLGQQWVMTEAGLEPVAKPLASYPRTGEGLGLKELGGLFPGHRMIAYRRRLAALVSQGANGAPAAQQ